MHNQESRILQYAMLNRLHELGWRDIEVIDDDLGRSAAGAVTRAGNHQAEHSPITLRKEGQITTWRPTSCQYTSYV
jgi:hypothetical protein